MPGTFETLTFRALASILDDLGLKALSVEKALPTVALYLASQARRSFDESRSPLGVPWAPLKNPSKRRGGVSAKPLRDNDVLMGSYTGQGAKSVAEVGRAVLRWGSNVDYASYHQEGTRRIPERPALGLSDRMRQRIGDIVLDRLIAQVKGS